MSGSELLQHTEVQFSPGVWTEVSADVIPSVDFSYGITGNTPNDRVADAGPLVLALDNSIYNSVHLAGAYSPGHANCRAGFDLGIKIRIWYEAPFVVSKYYKYQGTITRIEPLSDPDDFRTIVHAADWFEMASVQLVPALDVQTSQRSDQLFSTLISAMNNPPDNTRVGRGMESFPTAFDTAQAEGVYVAGELQKVCNSEMGFSFPSGDASLSGLVVFEDRRKRGASTTSVATFTSANFFHPVRDVAKVFDRVQVKIHPRSFDSGPVVIFTMLDKPQIVQKTSYGPVICTYKDNSQNRVRIGAKNQIDPVATTDFLFNSAADGSGTDLTANLSIVVTHHGSHSIVTITNNGSADGYLTFFRIRGQGYYDEGEVVFEAKDSVNQASLGDRPLAYEMPYQGDTTVSAQAAQYLLSISNVLYTYPETFGFIVCDPATTLQAIVRELSDRITIVDSASGISADFFINHIRHVYDMEGVLRVEFLLAPAPTAINFWILDSSQFSVLDSTTILAYGLWNQYWLLGDTTFGVLGSTTILS